MKTSDATAQAKLTPFALHVRRRDYVLGGLVVVLSVLAIVGLTVAWRGDMDFAMVIALGSSLQVALMVGPVLTLLSPLLGHRLTLVFAPVEIVAIAAGTLVTSIVSVDGESTWIEGLALVAVYVIFAAAIYVWPVGAA